MCPRPLLAPGRVLCPRHWEASRLTFAPQTRRQLISALVISLSVRLTSGFTHTDCQDGLSLSRVKGGRAGAVPMTRLLELCVTCPWGADRAPRPPGRASFLRSPCASDGVSVKVLGPVSTWFPGRALGGPQAEEAPLLLLAQDSARRGGPRPPMGVVCGGL